MDAEPARITWTAWLAGVICTAATVLVFISPQWIWESVP